MQRRGLILCTRTLVRILYIVLQRLIGRNSLKVLGLSTLGIKAMRVSARAGSILPKVNASLTNFHTSSPTMLQYCLKKTAWKPSGPGALKGFIVLRAPKTSSLLTGLDNIILSSSEMVGILSMPRCYSGKVWLEQKRFLK